MKVEPPLYDHHFFKPQPEVEPVFVVGLGRSGTTMLQLMLHRHSQLAMLSETWFCPRVWERRWSHPVREPLEPFRERLLDTFMRLLQKNDDFPIDFHAYRAAVLDGDGSLSRFLSELGSIWAKREGTQRWGEKTPVHVRYLDVLSKMFPSLRVLHIVRDPRDVAASLVRAPFAECEDPVAFALAWLETLEVEEKQSDENGLSDHLLRLRYEDLVSEPETTLRRVCAHLAVDYEPEMIEFHRAASDYAPEAPWMKMVRTPLSTTSIGRWRDDLTRDEVQAIEALCYTRMRRLHYEPEVSSSQQANIRLATRFREARKAWDREMARANEDHISMHRGDYKALLETVSDVL